MRALVPPSNSLGAFYMAKITLHGTPFQTEGSLPEIGQQAPDFTLANADLNDVTLADFGGKKKIISIVPSIDTPVCATTTRKFNEHAKAHGDVAVLVVSADLPFAHKRFCGADELTQVVTLSTFRSPNFARDYGVLIQDGPLAGLCARALVVLDADNKVLYNQFVEEVADEPDYHAALTAVTE